MGIKIRKRELIPEDTTIDAKIKAPKIVSGQWGRQVEANIEVLNGDYKGTEFKDWFSFARDKDTDEEYIPFNGKLYQLLDLVEDLDDLEDEDLERAIRRAVGKLDGFTITGRVAVLENKAKTNKRNALIPGSFGPAPSPKAEKKAKEQTEAEVNELSFDEAASDENNPLMNDER